MRSWSFGLFLLPRLLPLLLPLVVLGCNRTTVTPAGTTLIIVKNVEVNSGMTHGVGELEGPVTLYETTMRFRGPAVGPGARFRVSFEHGRAALLGDADAGLKPLKSAQGLRNLRISVVENTRFTMSATCSSYVFSEETPDAVLATKVNCTVTLARAAGAETIATNLDISAAGNVRATRGGEWDIDTN